MSGPAILVVEDDPQVAAGIVRGLRKAGFEPELATDGANGLARAADPRFALVVLDLMLPERDGIDVLRLLRARVKTPVIVVTARSDLPDRLRAFELGAVDFVPKPFFLEELVARIHTHLGRLRERPRTVLRFGDATFDIDARRVEVAGKEVRLTPSELAVLAHLIARPGRAVSRAELLALVSDDEESGPRNIDVHVARLRRKLGPSAQAISTVWGHGYRFEPRGAG